MAIRNDRMLGNAWSVSFCLVMMGLLYPFGLQAQGTQHPAQPNVVARYIAAIQRRDFKTVIDLTYSYQQEVARIKAANPQVLWPKLIGDYYQGKISSFSQQTGYWQNYGESLGAMRGDPAQRIRALQGLLPASCKWKVTESRTDLVQDSIAFGRYERTRVYVTVGYPSPTDSPIVDQKLLMNTILEFTANTKSQFIMAVSKVAQGDVYWTGGPDVRYAMGKRFFGAGLWDSAISQLEPLESENKLSPDGKELLASAYLERAAHQCFETVANPNVSGYPKYPRFKEGGSQQCLWDSGRAVSLKPSLGKEWANVLLTNSTLSLQAGAPDDAALFVRRASQFTAGDADLESRVAKSREAVGQYYLAMATNELEGWGRPEAKDHLREAIEMWPTGAPMRAVEITKERIRQAFESFGADGLGRAEEVLDLMKNIGLRIPAEEVPAFLRFGERMGQGARPEWERRVRELGAPAGALSPLPGVGGPTTTTEPLRAPVSESPAVPRPLLSEQDVIDLLRGNVPPSRIAALVKEHGVDFEITSDIKEKLRHAGATQGLIEALVKARNDTKGK